MADETIARLYEGDRLEQGLRDARARTLAIYAHLDLESMRVPFLAVVNPPVWELAHIAWFQEHWCLRWSASRGALVRDSMLRDADALLDSSTVPHATRWDLPYPPWEALRRYMDDTLEATLDALAATAPEDRYFFALALLHEDMHGEALLMTLQTLALPAPPIEAHEPPVSAPVPPRDIAFGAGEFEMGAPRDERGFVFDNEKWAHPVRVETFRMAERPVTQGEFLAFLDDGGYRREELWSPEGWHWLSSQERRAPRNWMREGAEWFTRRFDRWHHLDRHAPMMHVTLHEARAWCRWARRRLPTEAEWEYAARTAGQADRYPWGDRAPSRAAALDYRHAGPSSAFTDPWASRSGLKQLIGGVWEWTSSPFGPYPGFKPDPYHQYSQPWFETHFVMRGGSFATRSRLVHSRFRNFYTPDRADVFAGFRTCAID